MFSISINQYKGIVPYRASLHLPASKSESNRALIIQALADAPIYLYNMSEANDTKRMQSALCSKDTVLDMRDAGTTMRFLTAFFCIRNIHKILTGAPRMYERPIKILVEALKALGAKIDYIHRKGYPPLHVHGMPQQVTDMVTIDASVSSQYSSALLMIAPTLPKGLTLHLTGRVGSQPYLAMTLGLMHYFGVQASWKGNTIQVKPQQYQTNAYTIESDWTSASYWYSLLALSKHQSSEFRLLGLRKESFQGDQRIVEMMKPLGIKTTFVEDGVMLSKFRPSLKMEEMDFCDCPDLAPTLIVTCAAKGIACMVKGVESLTIKETNRIGALQRELVKIGAQLVEQGLGVWKLCPSTDLSKLKSPLVIHTYNDHRMAMAFAPLAMLKDIVIEQPKVVQKSYPYFWKTMEQVGFQPTKS